MQSNLETLDTVTSQFPLSARWHSPQIFSDKLALGNLEIAMLGVSAAGVKSGGVSASAVSLQGLPLKRAWFELVERSSILDFLAVMPSELEVFRFGAGSEVWPVDRVFGEETETSRPSKSNGVASHPQW